MSIVDHAGLTNPLHIGESIREKHLAIETLERRIKLEKASLENCLRQL
jgi:hypothetical protein